MKKFVGTQLKQISIVAAIASATITEWQKSKGLYILVKQFNWNKDKNQLLKAERNVSFEEITQAIGSGGLLDIVKHFNQDKYPNQKIFIVSFNDYVYIVPFVESEQEIFLKTIIPSRKMKKRYLKDLRNA